MVYTLGNLIIDLLLYIDQFPVQAQDLQGVSHIDVGPGGACNVAIVASRLGLPTACLGEIGDDIFGRLLLDSLARENIASEQIQVNPNKTTPVAGVLVDPQSEPAYLGYPGHLTLKELPPTWQALLSRAQALFVDGWIEVETMAHLNLSAMHIAQRAAVPIFFDPGPGNPRQDNRWHQEAARLATVILATEEEMRRLSGQEDALRGAQDWLDQGPRLIVIKKGADGAVFLTREETLSAAGLPVQAVDATGAGDSLAAAVIYATLKKLPLNELANLANATGAAKVGKVGTGHNLPLKSEIKAILQRFDLSVSGF